MHYRVVIHIWISGCLIVVEDCHFLTNGLVRISIAYYISSLIAGTHTTMLRDVVPLRPCL